MSLIDAEVGVGKYICVPKNEPLDPSLLPKNIMSCVALYPVLARADSEYLDDNYFQTKLQEGFLEKMKSKLGSGPSLGNMRKGFSTEVGKDIVSWQPTLKGGSLEILKYEPEACQATYYIAVFCPSTQISDEIATEAENMLQEDLVGASRPATFFRFIRESNYKSAQGLVRRNCDKIAYTASQLLDVFIKHKEDFYEPTSVSSQRYIGVPDTVNYFNHLDETKVNAEINDRLQTVDAVAVYQNCGSTGYSTGGFIVPISPKTGYEYYPNVKPSRSGQPSEIGNAVPFGVEWSEKTSLNDAERVFAQRYTHWDGKTQQRFHEKIRRDYSFNSAQSFDKYLSESPQRQRLRPVQVCFF